MPDTRPGTAPDEKRKCGSQPADQSLFTDVFRSRPLLYTIHCVTQLHASNAGRGIIAHVVLDLGHQRLSITSRLRPREKMRASPSRKAGYESPPSAARPRDRREDV